MDNRELSKEELEQVSGGCYLKEVDDKYYHYTGDKTKLNLKYVCPKCGKPVFLGADIIAMTVRRAGFLRKVLCLILNPVYGSR